MLFLINQFREEYGFLSNFYNTYIEYKGLTYKNSESAYQAAKTLDLEERKKFCNCSGKKAKALGKRLILRKDWEQVKDKVMEDIVRFKFNNNNDLKQKLLDTGNKKLVEGNWWNDKYWGVDLRTGVGENKLGKILMKIRDELKKDSLKMIFKEIKGDIFTAPNKYYLVHCISSDYALGAGIALLFEKKFHLKKQLKSIGKGIYPDCIQIGKIFNLVTKNKFWNKPSYDTLEKSLLLMKKVVKAKNIKYLAMPLIGCGLDKLSWIKVKEIIKKVFKNVDVFILIYHKK